MFCSYQAGGTIGCDIQAGHSFVIVDDQRVEVNAKVHSMSGYSAHADQQDLLAFVSGCSSDLGKFTLSMVRPLARRNSRMFCSTVPRWRLLSTNPRIYTCYRHYNSRAVAKSGTIHPLFCVDELRLVIVNFLLLRA